ncbi:MAG: aminotransferase class III-fold pyridoxal phosphate-dependent enzyme [Pseudomonadota bacterium]
MLALQSGELPATIHQVSRNPRIDWDGLPVDVVDAPRPWPQANKRLAAVSSFGFSGTNAHAILEAAPDEGGDVAGSIMPQVVVLSAPDEGGLSRLAGAAATAVSEGAGWEGIAAGLAVGRPVFAHRAGVVGADSRSLSQALGEVAAGRAPMGGAIGHVADEPPQVAFLFTGQGSQWAGMAGDLLATDTKVRETFERCAALADPLMDRSLFDVLDDDQALGETRYTQPALFALGYALAERLAAWGIVPDIMLGHSLGEITAACRAGVLTLDDAVRLVVARGALMGAAAGDGAMAAVFAPARTLETLGDALAAVDIAAENAPDETVVSGPKDAVDALLHAADTKGIGAQPMRTNHAFHSRLMDAALPRFADAIEGLSFHPPGVPLVSNVTGTTDAPFDDPRYWVRQIREPVRFSGGLSAVADAGVRVLVEVGPAAILSGLAKRAPSLEGATIVPTLRRRHGAAETLGTALASLHVAGVPVQWDAVFPRSTRAHAPGYPFAKTPHWTPDEGRRDAASSVPPLASQSLQDTVEAADDAPPVVPALDETTVRADALAILTRSIQVDASGAEGDRSFLELGVDSLALTEAVAGLERKLALAIPRRELFQTLTTPRKLVDHVVKAVMAGGTPSLTPISAPAAIPAPVVHSPTQNMASAEPLRPDAVSLSAAATAALTDFSQAYVARTERSRNERERFGPHLADSRAVAGFSPTTRATLYPIVGARAEGAQFTDVDGNTYVDVTMGFGVQLFGHNPPFIAKAIRDHLDGCGTLLGPQAALAGEVAERLCRMTGNARAAFCNSGTEAVMTALRLARNATGRRRIALFQGSYHGHFDGTLAQPAADGTTIPLASGTTEGMVEDVLVLDYGDPDGALQAIRAEGDRLAAVIVEPVQSRRPDRQPRAFLQDLRALTTQTGAALIFDEVLLGFRVAQGGAQAWAGVDADIVTYGKIVGGSLPIGVVAGHARFLDGLDGGAWRPDGASQPHEGRTFFAGTFNKSPMAMAAANAVLTHLEAAGPELQEQLNARTDAFVERLNAILQDEAAGMSVQHFSSLFRFIGASDLFYRHLVLQGVYVWEGRTCFLSTAHTDADLDAIAQGVRAAVRAMRAATFLRAGPADGPERLPVTPGQSALLTLAAFSPQTSAAYNQSVTIDLTGDLDMASVRSALHTLVERHESLRTTFDANGTMQRVHAALPPVIEDVDHSLLTSDASGAELEAVALSPFDLVNGPLFRACLVRRGETRHSIVLILPHVITDGWSLQLLAAELAEIYNAHRLGRVAELAPAVPFRRYVAHNTAGASLPALRDHWLSLFEQPPAPLDLPADRPRPALQSYKGARVSGRLDPALWQALRARAREAGVSPFALALTAYTRLLGGLTGARDMVVAIFSAGQPEIAAPTLAGYCVSVLPLRLGAADGPDEPAMKATQHAVTTAVAHRDYALADLVRALKLRRDPSRPPLASVSFNLDTLDAVPRFDGLSAQMDANAHGAVRWDLNWNLVLSADGVRVEATYNRDLFDADRVAGWVDTYTSILAEMAGHSVAPDRPTALPAAKATATLAGHVHAFAATTPDAIAVRDGAGAVDYRTLTRMAGALSARLSARGAGPGKPVAFRLERGVGPVAAMLAAQWIGAPFVPLDTDAPDHHHASVLADSGAVLLVVEPGSAMPDTDVPVIPFRRDEAGPAEDPVPVDPEAIAYILYTSGSTGRPRGVRVPHRAVSTYVEGVRERLGMAGPLSAAIVSSFAADLGYTSVLLALCSGGTLHAPDAETARDPHALGEWFGASRPDVLKIVPSHFGALLDAPGAAQLLPRKALILGGDVLSWPLVDCIKALQPSCRVFNHYGPTETTIGATMTEADDALREGNSSVPIGRPLQGYGVAIVDPDGNAVADGGEGEILITGDGVALGYTQAGANRADRFAPFGDERAYRTGDRGRCRSDGRIVFVGRADDMVKIRGHRVEPAGIAELLRSHPAVNDAVVLVERHEGRPPSLFGAVTGEVDPKAISHWLSQKVPPALVPSRIVVRDDIPLTANGKVDRQLILSDAAAPPVADGGTVPAALLSRDEEASRDATIATLCALWAEALHCDEVGPDDDFFELGGDSILAIQIVGRARKNNIALTPPQLFQAPTPRQLARLAQPAAPTVRGVDWVEGQLPLTPIQRWFAATPMPERARWCLSAVFDLATETDAAALGAAARALVQRHDALRIRVDVASMAQSLGPAYDPLVIVRRAPFSGEAEDRLADDLMAGIDPLTGHTIALGALVDDDTRQTHLVLAVHHAVFDVLSFAIVAEDLGDLLLRKADSLQDTTTTWSYWASTVAERAAAASDEIDYWRAVCEAASRSSALSEAGPAAGNCEGNVAERRHHLACGPLFEALAAGYGLRAHESAFALVARAAVEWAQSAVAFDLEGHGRQSADQQIDLSRTVGWFTARYPFVVPDGGEGDLRAFIIDLKERLRGVPNQGVGYGLLRYGATREDATLMVDPPVSFNFVGELGQFGSGAVDLVRVGAGQERAPSARRRHAVTVDCWLDEGQLVFSCRFAPGIAESAISDFLSRLEQVSSELITAANTGGTVYTPSDFSGIDFSQDELDQLAADLDGLAETD